MQRAPCRLRRNAVPPWPWRSSTAAANRLTALPARTMNQTEWRPGSYAAARRRVSLALERTMMTSATPSRMRPPLSHASSARVATEISPGTTSQAASATTVARTRRIPAPRGSSGWKARPCFMRRACSMCAPRATRLLDRRHVEDERVEVGLRQLRGLAVGVLDDLDVAGGERRVDLALAVGHDDHRRQVAGAELVDEEAAVGVRGVRRGALGRRG